MKIRTDFVTNSSSSSFTVAVCFKMDDGKEITQSVNWGDEETDLVVNKDPLSLSKAKDINELVEMLNDSIFIGVEGWDEEADDYMYDEDGENVIVKADEDEYGFFFEPFGSSIKSKLKKYSMDNIETIIMKVFETSEYTIYEYSKIPPKYYGADDFDSEDYHQTHYRVYRYDLKTKKATYFDDHGYVETNGGVGGRTKFILDDCYIDKDDYKTVENDETPSR